MSSVCVAPTSNIILHSLADGNKINFYLSVTLMVSCPTSLMILTFITHINFNETCYNIFYIYYYIYGIYIVITYNNTIILITFRFIHYKTRSLLSAKYTIVSI